MWIFMSEAFLSVVAHRTKPGVLLVRARRAGEIERAFAGYKFRVRRTPGADYLYRAELAHMDVREVLANQVNTIEYDNFKGSVADGPRREAYGKVWAVMMGYQQETSGLSKSAHLRPRARAPRRRR